VGAQGGWAEVIFGDGKNDLSGNQVKIGDNTENQEQDACGKIGETQRLFLLIE
jgi:hypothetical protein